MRQLNVIAPFAALLIAALTFPAHAQNPGEISEFIAYLDSAVRAIQDKAGAQLRCRDLTNRLMEVERMAQAAVPKVWYEMTSRQRGAYVAAFQGKMVSECVRVTRDNHAETVTLEGVRSVAGGELLVSTKFSGDDRVVIWRVRNTGARMQAVDVISNGRSAVLTARQDYARLLEANNGDIDGLIVYMGK